MATGLHFTSRERMLRVHAISSSGEINMAFAPWDAASASIFSILSEAGFGALVLGVQGGQQLGDIAAAGVLSDGVKAGVQLYAVLFQ